MSLYVDSFWSWTPVAVLHPAASDEVTKLVDGGDSERLEALKLTVLPVHLGIARWPVDDLGGAPGGHAAASGVCYGSTRRGNPAR